MEFEYKGEQFKYYPFSVILNADILPKRKDYKQSKYLDHGCGFDIETSKVPNESLSFMYVWQFAIDDVVIIGRTWDEFTTFLDIIAKHFETNKKPLLCFIHNMNFEFSFIKRRVKWKSRKGKKQIFALEQRKVIKAITEHNIEFRDSYILTQMTLSQMAKSYELGFAKLDGDDFDYNELRFSDTELTNEQMAYCIRDVQILSAFYHKYIKQEFVKKLLEIPLTSTGIVRNELKRAYKKIPKKERVKYKRFVKNAYPNETMYNAMIKYLYRGGMTHSNIALTGKAWVNLGLASYDIKSSYPATMCHEKFPGEFLKRPVEWFYNYGFNKKITKDYAYMGIFIFRNIRAKTSFSLESKNKIIQYSDDAIFDNGRLVSASWINVMLCEVDMNIYRKIYAWGDESRIDEIECLEIYRAKKEYLPTFLIDLVLKYFALKETLEDGYERNIVKSKLNAFYGMLITSIFHENLEFNEKTGMFKSVASNKTFEQLVDKQIVLCQWAIWVSAYSRMRLCDAMVKCDSHHNLYNDTDSIKVINVQGCEWVFKAHNDLMERLNNTMYVGKYDRELFKDLGKYQFEGKYIKAKALGSKRYIYSYAKKNKETNKFELSTNVVVAGMTRGSLQAYCKKESLDIYEEFNNGLKLEPKDANKLTSVYEDARWSRKIEGHKVTEESCVTLVPIPFSMKMAPEYIALILAIQEKNNRTYGRKGVI